MADFITRIPCPGHEFGLEDCEEHITFKHRVVYGGYFNPPEAVEDDEWKSWCDCLEQLGGVGNPKEWPAVANQYCARVNELLDAAEPEADYPDEDDYI